MQMQISDAARRAVRIPALGGFQMRAYQGSPRIQCGSRGVGPRGLSTWHPHPHGGAQPLSGRSPAFLQASGFWPGAGFRAKTLNLDQGDVRVMPCPSARTPPACQLWALVLVWRETWTLAHPALLHPIPTHTTLRAPPEDAPPCANFAVRRQEVAAQLHLYRCRCLRHGPPSRPHSHPPSPPAIPPGGGGGPRFRHRGERTRMV